MNVIGVTVIFIICQSVKIVPDLYEMIYCRIGTSGLRKQVKNVRDWDCTVGIVIDSIIDISHLMLAINSSVNVIIYTLRGAVT